MTHSASAIAKIETQLLKQYAKFYSNLPSQQLLQFNQYQSLYGIIINKSLRLGLFSFYVQDLCNDYELGLITKYNSSITLPEKKAEDANMADSIVFSYINRPIKNTELEHFIANYVNTNYINAINTIDTIFLHSNIPSNIVPSSVYQLYQSPPQRPKLNSIVTFSEYLATYTSFYNVTKKLAIYDVYEFIGCEKLPALYLSNHGYTRSKTDKLPPADNVLSLKLLLPRNLTFKLVSINTKPKPSASVSMHEKTIVNTNTLVTSNIINNVTEQLITVYTYKLLNYIHPPKLLLWNVPDDFTLKVENMPTYEEQLITSTSTPRIYSTLYFPSM